MQHSQSHPYILPLLAAVALNITLVLYTMRRQRVPEARTFILLMIALTTWMLGQLMELSSSTLPVKWLWVRIEYLGILLIPIIWLVLILQYTHRRLWLTPRRLALLFAPFLMTALLIWTNERHYLFWREVTSSDAPFASIQTLPGPWFWIHVLLSYSYLVAGMVLLLHNLAQPPRLARRRSATLLVGAFIPWCFTILFLFELSVLPQVDPTPFALAISALIAAWGIFRLLDIVPAARDFIFESMHDGVIVLDGSSRVVDLNQAAARLLARAPREILGKPVLQFLPALVPLIEVPTSLYKKRMELILEEGQGHYELSLSPLADRQGENCGHLLILHDITERRQAEENAQRLAQEQAARAEAEAMQQRFAFLAEATGLLATSLDYETTLAQIARLAVPALADYCLIDMLDEEGRLCRKTIVHAEPTKEAILLEMEDRGYRPEGMNHPLIQALSTGKSMLIPVVTDDQLQRAAHDQEHLRLLRALGPKSGMSVPLLREEPLGVISFGLDRPGRRYGPADLALAEELARRAAIAIDHARLYREAQEAVRERDTFLSIASHELKSPITTIKGYADLVQRRASRGEAQESGTLRSLHIIYKESNRLNQLLNLLLDLSRLQSGQLSIERRPLDLCALARQLVEVVQPTLTSHTLRLQCPGEPCLVEGDELRLDQVLHNLLNNAVKYSPGGGEIFLQLEQRAGQTYLSITDEGIGIPPDALAHLFKRFYRANNAKSCEINGMGLGLYVARQIVEAHCGTIQVTSEPGVGSTFTLVLPVAR